MRLKALSVTLALVMILAIPASATNADNFQNGKLSGITATETNGILVTDTFNKVVWQMKGDSVVRYAGAISVADMSGEPAAVYQDGTSDKAYFKEPWDIASFVDGYAVSDAETGVIRYIADGRVYTLQSNSTFKRPTGLTTDTSGNLYIADSSNGTITRMAKDGKTSVFAKDFAVPTGIAWYGNALYVVESGKCVISRVVNDKKEIFAGTSDATDDVNEYIGGYVDGPAVKARFEHPQGIAIGSDGTVYVADTGNSAVRAIKNGIVYTIARGSSTTLLPTSPRGLAISGETLYAADAFSGDILRLNIGKRSYKDVPAGVWYAEAVDAVVQRCIIKGTSAETFEPDITTSRAMLVTMLSRLHQNADGSVIIDGDSLFPDVENGSWYEAPSKWAADNEIVKGDGGLFVPNRDISREELVTMLYRYASSQGYDTSSADNLSKFQDAATVSAWARDAMSWACAKGIINGISGNLNPNGTATRAQTAKVLYEFMIAYNI